MTYDYRRDLHDLGVVFAQTLFGVDVVFAFASPSALLASCASKGTSRAGLDSSSCAVPPNFSEAATGLLSELLAGSKMTATALSKRLVFAMKSDGTLSTSASAVKTLLRQSDATAGGPKTPMKSPSFARTPVAPLTEEGQRGLFWQPQTAPQMSRYRADFEEVEFLGAIDALTE